MSVTTTFPCDLCGQKIEDDDQFVTVSAEDARIPAGHLKRKKRRWSGGCEGHYHTAKYGPKRCYEQLDDLFRLLRDRAEFIGDIPVAHARAIEAMREGHRNPGRDAVAASPEGIDLSPEHTELSFATGLTSQPPRRCRTWICWRSTASASSPLGGYEKPRTRRRQAEMALRGIDRPEENPTREAKAFMRISNAISADLPALESCPHWHEALRNLRERRAASPARRDVRPRIVKGEGT